MKKTVKKEAGCFIFQRKSVSSPSSNIRCLTSFEKQLVDCDTHEYALEQETLYDKAMIMYTTMLENGAGVVPKTVDGDVILSLEYEGPVPPTG